jgi:hypothetical protein
MTHITETGMYAGRPICGCNKEERATAGDNFSHLPYCKIDAFFMAAEDGRRGIDMDWTRFHALGAEGRLTFSNGDKATGEGYEEEGRVWYRAIAKDGKEYETATEETTMHAQHGTFSRTEHWRRHGVSATDMPEEVSTVLEAQSSMRIGVPREAPSRMLTDQPPFA